MAASESFRSGISFGLTSGVLTTLGLIVGLHAGTHSKAVVAGAIITIAIADALSDALGIHVHEESEGVHTTAQVWSATAGTLVAKFVMAATFLVPVLTLDLGAAIIASLAWGGLVLAVFSYRVAAEQGRPPLRSVVEHLVIGVVVVSITHFVGDWVGETFR